MSDDEVPFLDDRVYGRFYSAGWNACRDAFLARQRQVRADTLAEVLTRVESLPASESTQYIAEWLRRLGAVPETQQPQRVSVDDVSVLGVSGADLLRAVADFKARRDAARPSLTSLLEQGRRLASQRDDLIAQGVDPAELPVPLAPTDEDGR